MGNPSECEEAILKVTRQKRTVLQVLDRPSLGVQDALYSLDDFIAMSLEELEQFDVCLKRHLARTRARWPLIGGKERMKSQASNESIRSIGEGEGRLTTKEPTSGVSAARAGRRRPPRAARRSQARRHPPSSRTGPPGNE